MLRTQIGGAGSRHASSRSDPTPDNWPWPCGKGRMKTFLPGVTFTQSLAARRPNRRCPWHAQAQKIFAARLDGRDPALEKFKLETAPCRRSGGRLVETFISERLSDLRSARVPPAAPGANRNIAKILKTFFRWCVGRAVIDFSPVKGSSFPPDRVPTALNTRTAAVILTGARCSASAPSSSSRPDRQRREEVAPNG